MLDDVELRRRYAAAAEAPGTPHPTDAEWERLALREMNAVERAGVLSHVTRCAACARTYRGLQLLESEAREFDGAVPPTEAPRAARPRPWLIGGLAAAAAFAGWAVLRPLPTSSVGEDSHAGSGRPADVRGAADAAPLAPRPLEPVGGGPAPSRFRWEGVTDARAYRVRLLRADGTPVWTSDEVSVSEVEWPRAVTPAPGSYMWRVDALPGWGASGDAVSSPFAVFSITASPR